MFLILFIFIFVFILAILLQKYPIAILIGVVLMTNDMEFHVLIGLLNILFYDMPIHIIVSVAYFPIWSFFFFLGQITFIKQFSENLLKKNINCDNCIYSGLKRPRKEWQTQAA